MKPPVEAIIVGQGLAGTALAWSLAQRGIRFVVIDNELPNTSSRIAAGLVTPVTGKRAVMSWAWKEAWGVAQQYYPEIESITKVPFWSVQPSLRLYETEIERTVIEARLPNYSSELITPYAPINDTLGMQPFDQTLGGFVMKTSARLDAATYLNASREAFQKQNAYQSMAVDTQNDIEVRGETIRIPKLDIEGRKIIFCQGHVEDQNPWFPNLPLGPAQGDILTLDIPGLQESRTIHRGIWITPVFNQVSNLTTSHFLVGSTYRWRPLDGLPSLAGRDEIISKLKRWLKIPFEVVDHRAAIRPASFDQRPLLGPSLLNPNVWVFNGLGAKGALLAPWCARQLVDILFDGMDIQKVLRWDRRR